MPRSISAIAREIRKDWTNLSVHAAPYLSAMESLTSVNDNYYADTGRSVVLYFLSNASGWRGETARRIKNELKTLLRG